MSPIVVYITGGGGQTWVDDAWRLARSEIIGALNVNLQAEKLKMSGALPLVSDLMKELHEFQMRPPRINPNDPEAWRERPCDDLVLAVAVAAWRAGKYVPIPEDDEDDIEWNDDGRCDSTGY